MNGAQQVYARLTSKRAITLYGMDADLIGIVNARLIAGQSYKRILRAIKAYEVKHNE